MGGTHEDMSKPYKGSMSHRDYKWTRHIVPWWYTHVQIWYANINVKEKTLQADTNLQRQMNRQTELFRNTHELRSRGPGGGFQKLSDQKKIQSNRQ